MRKKNGAKPFFCAKTSFFGLEKARFCFPEGPAFCFFNCFFAHGGEKKLGAAHTKIQAGQICMKTGKFPS